MILFPARRIAVGRGSIGTRATTTPSRGSATTGLPRPTLLSATASCSMSKSKATLIVTADDFGLSPQVNEAVERGHCEGILSAASLMVGAPAFDDAVRRALTLPKLGVGLHVTLLDGRPVLSTDNVPELVGADGRFFSDLASLGTKLYFSRELRRQASAEIEAQFQRFADAGLAPDHINAHKHFHLHPVVLDMILEFVPDLGSPPIRVPFEPFASSFGANRDRTASRMLAAWFYGPQ